MQSQLIFLLLGVALGQKLKITPQPELLDFLARAWVWVVTTTPTAVGHVNRYITAQLAVSTPTGSTPTLPTLSPAAPVEAAPVEAAPVEAAPVEAAPVEAAPAESGAVDLLTIVEPLPKSTAAKAMARGARAKVTVEA